MSKQKVLESELKALGFEWVELPRCEAQVLPKWYKPNGGQCPFDAVYQSPNGNYFCVKHAKIAAQKMERPQP